MKLQRSDPEAWLKNLSEENLRVNQRSKDYFLKSPAAIDYSEISELADDPEDGALFNQPGSQPQDGTSHQTAENIGSCFASSHNLNVKLSSTSRKNKGEEPVEVNSNDKCVFIIGEDVKQESEYVSVPCCSQIEDSRKLDRPLASYMPLKYKHEDVGKLFPEFRHGKPLRFLRLFGPGKQSNLPQIYHNFKSRRRRRKRPKTTTVAVEKTNDSNGALKENARASSGWTLSISDSPPPPEMVETDDEEKMKRCSIIENNVNSGSHEYMKSDNSNDCSDYDELELGNASDYSDNDHFESDNDRVSNDGNILSNEDSMLSIGDSMSNNDDENIVLRKAIVNNNSVFDRTGKSGSGCPENEYVYELKDDNVKHIKHVVENKELKEAILSISRNSKAGNSCASSAFATNK